MKHRPNKKQHATCPAAVRERRHRDASLARAEKREERLARAAARRAGVIFLPASLVTVGEVGPELVVVLSAAG